MVSPASDATANKLVSRNEEVMVNARRNFYQKIRKERKHEKRLEFGQYIGLS